MRHPPLCIHFTGERARTAPLQPLPPLPPSAGHCHLEWTRPLPTRSTWIPVCGPVLRSCTHSRPVSGRCDDKRVVGRWSVGRRGVKEDSECSLSPVSLDYKRLPFPSTLPVAGKELMTYLGREMEDTQDLIEQSFTLFINLHFASSSVGPSRTLRSLTVGGREGEGWKKTGGDSVEGKEKHFTVGAGQKVQSSLPSDLTQFNNRVAR